MKTTWTKDNNMLCNDVSWNKFGINVLGLPENTWICGVNNLYCFKVSTKIIYFTNILCKKCNWYSNMGVKSQKPHSLTSFWKVIKMNMRNKAKNIILRRQALPHHKNHDKLPLQTWDWTVIDYNGWKIDCVKKCDWHFFYQKLILHWKLSGYHNTKLIYLYQINNNHSHWCFTSWQMDIFW